MKIPLYTSQARPSGEAPGRSIRARMQAEPFIRAELEKGNTFGAAADQIAQFADMRYKMVREAQLNDALIAAEESLRDETRDLSESKDIYNVLDGDAPIWNKNVEGIRKTLREKVGKDKNALRSFDERFKQFEMSQRYKLRGVIDTKIEKAIQAQRLRKMQGLENDAVRAATYDEVFLKLQDAGIDSQRLSSVLGGDINALKSQEYAMVKRIAGRRIENILKSSTLPTTAISKLREAVFAPGLTDDERRSLLVDPSLNGAGLVEYELMQLLSIDDRVTLTRAGESISQFIDGPTLEQQKLIKEKSADVNIFSDTVGVMQDAVDKGMMVPEDQITQAVATFNELSPFMSESQQQSISTNLNNLNATQKFASQIRSSATPDNIDTFIDEARSGELSGDPELIDAQDVKRVEFLENFKSEMITGLAEDPVEFVERVGSVPVSEVTLTPQAAVDGNMGISGRISVALKTSSIYGNAYVPKTTLLKKEEANQLVSLIQSDPDAGYLMLDQIQKEAGNYSQAIFDQLEDAGLNAELSALMDVTDGNTRQLLAQASKMNDAQTTELFKTIDPAGKNTTETNVDASLSSTLKDFREVYRAGRPIDADIAFGKRVNAAKKVIGLYMAQGVDQATAEQIVLDQVFSHRENVYNSSKGTYFIPDVGKDIADDIDRKLNAIISTTSLFDVMPIADLPMAMRSESRSIINQDALTTKGRLLLNDAGDGVILHYTLPNGLPLPAYQVNGQLFEIKFKDVNQLHLSVMEVGISQAKAEDDPTIGAYEMGAEIRRKALEGEE